MLNRLFLTIFLFLFSPLIAVLIAQTGPGGVGNSTSNGLWLRADNISQANNTAVATWTDASGNGNDANQGTPALQPLFFTTSSLNNMPIVRLDGGNDEMAVTDAAILDGTSGITYYAVIRPNNLNGAPRGILGKRITFTSSAEYAYTWFFHGSNRLNLDVHTQNNRFNTGATTFSNATNYILSWDFDGTLAASQRSRMRTGSTNILRSTESSTVLPNSNQNLAIGALNVGYGTYLGADYAEIIHFNYALDTVDHILVQNYLSAKYNISIAANDLYDEDDVANGNYDFDVAGIGRISATEINNDGQGSGIVRILNPTGLGNDEFLIWGHDGGLAQAQEYTDVPAGVQARFVRVWRASEVNSSSAAVDVGSIDVRFDLSNLGAITAGDLRLLVDTDNDGVFADETPISGATNVGGSVYAFAGVTSIANNLRFTIATADKNETPLPIELLSFNAHVNGSKVDISWVTASEVNNDYFTIQKSKDGSEWEDVLITEGAGNSVQTLNYFDSDYSPYKGLSYYRLKQTDFDGNYTYSNIVPVKYEDNAQGNLNLFPNPIEGGNLLNVSFEDIEEEEVLVVLRDITGKEFYSKLYIDIEKGRLIGLPIEKAIPAGIYLITATSESRIYSQKLIVK